jgi:hypothetical protein
MRDASFTWSDGADRTEEQRIEDMKLIISPEHQTPWKQTCFRNLRLKIDERRMYFSCCVYCVEQRSLNVIIKHASRTRTNVSFLPRVENIGAHQSLIRSTCHLQQHRKAEEAPVVGLHRWLRVKRAVVARRHACTYIHTYIKCSSAFDQCLHASARAESLSYTWNLKCCKKGWDAVSRARAHTYEFVSNRVHRRLQTWIW